MLWVAAREDDLAIGFLLAQRQDASIHILEMDVMTEYAGHGIGTALLATVSQFAVAQGARFITLTTFEHLPWNAPFYAKRGFSPVKDISAFPHLAAALGREAASGLMNRVAMVKHELAEEVSQAREMGGRLDHRATSP